MRLFFFSLILVSFCSNAQTPQDQNVFQNRVWKGVMISNSEKSFFDSNDKYIGSRVETKNSVVYRDKWKRVIKVFPKTVVQPKKVSKKTKSFKKNKARKNNENRIIVRRNKAFYYDTNGSLERTAKRRGKRKVYFHNAKGKLIGYKIYQSNGITVYKDSRGRVTGTSYIDGAGKMIYRPKNRKRRTSKVLFDDPFLFRR